MKAPCGRRGDHRHRLSWKVPGKSSGGLVIDRCNSALLWSAAAFHILAGDAVTLDGEPLVDGTRGWSAAAYLEALSARTTTRGLAARVRRTLARRRSAEE